MTSAYTVIIVVAVVVVHTFPSSTNTVSGLRVSQPCLTSVTSYYLIDQLEMLLHLYTYTQQLIKSTI